MSRARKDEDDYQDQESEESEDELENVTSDDEDFTPKPKRPRTPTARARDSQMPITQFTVKGMEAPIPNGRSHQSLLGASPADDDDGTGDFVMDTPEPPKRKRGRPPGSGSSNRTTSPTRRQSARQRKPAKHYDDDSEEDEDMDEMDLDDSSKPRRGRPPISDFAREVYAASKRVTRVRKRTNYAELDGEDDSEEEAMAEKAAQAATPSDAVEDDAMVEEKLTDYFPTDKVLEKIVAYREVKHHENDPANVGPHKHEINLADDTQTPKTYEFLVKWRGLSYLHTDWVPQKTIESARMGKTRMQKFFATNPEVDPEDPFEPDFIEADRILSRKTVEDKTLYFVKWRGLPYNESTWELEKDVNDAGKFADYEFFNRIPAPEDVIIPPRPPAESWEVISSLPFKDENALRAYQIEGVNWLRFCWFNRRNSILADEMGLGKTIQSVSMLYSLKALQKTRGPFLVMAPLSTIPHWKREFDGWTDMNCIVYHGNVDARDKIRQFEFYYDSDEPHLRNVFKFNVMVTTYETIMTDSAILRPIHWEYVVIDEAHRLKNKQSVLLQEFRTFSYTHLLLLTGTPIQNNTQELWTLLNVLDRAKFPSLDGFMKEYGDLKDADQLKNLQDVLRPYLLRRLKEDVEKSIAPKEETIIEVELTTIQKTYYRAVLERNFDHLAAKGRANLPSLINIMMQLRKCCNHPFLLKGVEEQEIRGKMSPADVNKVLIESSGKLVLIDKLLPKLKAGGHKVLIFSQMVRVLDILEDYLNYRSYKHERIDGSIRGNDRQGAIDRFSKKDSDIFIFLLCTRAGGVGINLTAADTVIIFDSDWNPQNDIQAQARCHRIGQDKAVKVYRLLTRKTYERQMFDRASLKLGLDAAVLNNVDSGAGDNGKPKFTQKEVDVLLKQGAYGAFNDDDKESEKFHEENIDDILEHRTTRIVHENVATGSGFSKASFASESSNAELDVNDPDFWKKLMPDMAAKPNPDIIYEPRQRRQVQRGKLDDKDLEDLGSSSEDDGAKEEVDSQDEAYVSEEVPEGPVRRGYRPRGDESPTSHTRKPWNQSQRNRFSHALLVIGFGRWREIKRTAKLHTHTAYEIGCFGRAFFRKLMAILEIPEEEEEKMLDRVMNAEPEDFNEPEETTPPPNRTVAPASVVAAAAAATPIVVDITSSSNSIAPTPAPVPAPDTMDVEAKIEPGVKVEPISVHASTDSIPTDAASTPSLAASTDIATTSTADVKDETQTDPDAPPAKPEPVVISMAQLLKDVDRLERDPILNDDRFLDNLKRVARQTLRRIELLRDIGKIIRSNFNNPATWPKIEQGVTMPWWGEREDKDLLLGTFKHGFSKYPKIRRDKSLIFYSILEPMAADEDDEKEDDEGEDKNNLNDDEDDDKDDETKPKTEPTAADGTTPSQVGSDGQALHPWPGSKVLTHRVKHLVKELLGIKTAKRSGGRPGRKPNPEKDRTLRQLKLESEWSKRERHDFYRAVITFGVPLDPNDMSKFNFEPIQREARLKNKSIDAIQTFYLDFVEVCKHIKKNKLHKKQKPRPSGKKTAASAAAVVGAADSPSGAEVALNMSTGDDETNEDIPEEDRDIHRRATESGLTYTQAKRASDRMSFFILLRRKMLTLSDKELVDRLKNFKTREGMPAWWTIDPHDIALLKGANEYGWGRWEALCKDPKHPFRVPALAKMKEEGINTAEFEKADAAAEKKGDQMEVEKPAAEEDEDGEEEKHRLFAKHVGFPRDKVLWKRVNLITKLFNDQQPQLTLAPGTSATATIAAAKEAAATKKKQATLNFSKPAAGPEGTGVIKDMAKKRKRKQMEPAPDAASTPTPVPSAGRSHPKTSAAAPAPSTPKNPRRKSAGSLAKSAGIPITLVADEEKIDVDDSDGESAPKRAKLNTGEASGRASDK